MKGGVRPHELELLSPLPGLSKLELGNKRSANGVYVGSSRPLELLMPWSL